MLTDRGDPAERQQRKDDAGEQPRRGGDYDYVFVDRPTRPGDVRQSAAVAADVAVFPMQPSPFDFWAVARDARIALSSTRSASNSDENRSVASSS